MVYSKPFRSLYSAAQLSLSSLITRPSTARATSFCREHCSMLHVATQVPQPSFRVSRQCRARQCRASEARSTRQVVVRAYGRAPKALHRHQTALATDIESSRLAAPAIVARIQPVVQWSFTFGVVEVQLELKFPFKAVARREVPRSCLTPAAAKRDALLPGHICTCDARGRRPCCTRVVWRRSSRRL